MVLGFVLMVGNTLVASCDPSVNIVPKYQTHQRVSKKTGLVSPLFNENTVVENKKIQVGDPAALAVLLGSPVTSPSSDDVCAVSLPVVFDQKFEETLQQKSSAFLSSGVVFIRPIAKRPGASASPR